MTDQNTNTKQGDQFKYALLRYKEGDIDQSFQQTLNNPLSRQTGLDEKDTEFLTMLIAKIDKGEINLYQPSTLLNYPVYDKLSSEAKGKADFSAVNMLTTIREISKLWKLQHRDTYQIENLTHQLRLIKERLEKVGGDIYII